MGSDYIVALVIWSVWFVWLVYMVHRGDTEPTLNSVTKYPPERDIVTLDREASGGE